MSNQTQKTVTLPWGRAVIEQEIVVEGDSSDAARPVEIGVARLRDTDRGDESLRFFYRIDGRTMRGPVTLRAGEIERLAEALAKAPEVFALVRGLTR